MRVIKNLLRNCFATFLKVNVFRKIWIKAIEATLLTKDVDGFKQTQLKFIEFATKNRLHIVSTEPQIDIDFTFLKIKNNNLTHDHNLIEILERTCSIMRETLKADFALNDLQIAHTNSDDSRKTIFSLVPELRATDNHYLFINSIAIATNAEKVVDLGTASGSSLVSFLSAKNVRFVDTFDLSPVETNSSWVSQQSKIAISEFLTENQTRWAQHIGNLEDMALWEKYKPKFVDADLILIDTQHLGDFEKLMSQRFITDLNPNTLFVWDDIRLSSMVEFWDSLQMKKLDVGGLGHISGTGISKL